MATTIILGRCSICEGLFSPLESSESWLNGARELNKIQTRTGGWGHPVGIRAAADWHLCPPLALPSGYYNFDNES